MPMGSLRRATAHLTPDDVQPDLIAGIGDAFLNTSRISMTSSRGMAAKRPAARRFILDCDRSAGVRMDWTFADAVEAGVVADVPARAEVDLRADDWPVRDQGTTGACVGFAAADGVLHWHYRQARGALIGRSPASAACPDVLPGLSLAD